MSCPRPGGAASFPSENFQPGGSNMVLDRFSLKGKVAAVTGGGQGIGAATAQALGEAGAAVAILDLDAARAEGSAGRLRDRGIAAEGLPLDVTSSRDVDRVAAELERRHGRVDVLVNNAGIAISEVPAEKMTDEQWRKVLAVNLDGVFYCCRAFGRGMLERRQGAIVNVGSMSGDIVNRPQEQCQYNASKAGVHHLTRSLAAEWAERGVRAGDRLDADEASRPPGGGRLGGGLPRIRGCEPDDGRRRGGGWWIYVLVGKSCCRQWRVSSLDGLRHFEPVKKEKRRSHP